MKKHPHDTMEDEAKRITSSVASLRNPDMTWERRYELAEAIRQAAKLIMETADEYTECAAKRIQ